MPDSIMVVTKTAKKTKKEKENRIRNQTFLHVDLLIWRRSVHCTKAETNPEQFGPRVVVLSSLPWCFFLTPSLFEAEALNGVMRTTHTDTEREARTFLLSAAFVPWLATPTWMAELRHRAEQESRTRPHQLPLLPASQTRYRHGALHCMNHAQQ